MSSPAPKGGPLPPWVVTPLRYLHLVGCAVLVLIMLWIGADVVLRGVVGQTVPDTHELVAYTVPVAVFLQIPYVLATDGHLLSPLIVERAPRPVRAGLLLLREIAGVTFCAIATWASLPAALSSAGSGTTYGHTRVLPLSVGFARMLIASGLTLVTVIFAWRLVAQVQTLLAPRASD